MFFTVPRGLAAAALLSVLACSEAPPEAAAPSSRPVKTFIVAGGEQQSLRRFPGLVNASQRAELSFRVSGTLQELLVVEGQEVTKNQVLARLDPTDYRIVLEDRQATFDNAQSNFNRAKGLVASGNISRLDFDQMEANFRSARAALTQAEQDLAYTELRAPFTGRVANRLVENFEDILARQTVINLQNVQQLDLVINVPESMVRNLHPINDELATTTGNALQEPAGKETIAFASFEGRPSYQFPLQLKEVATKADAQTQTFQVTMTMPAPAEFAVLPGMTATVTVDMTGRLPGSGGRRLVPLDAVQADSELQSQVWILDAPSMTVSSQPVTLGRVSGDEIEVESGLLGGEEIVAVGAHYLSEGMKVTRMRQTEQAQPRPGDRAVESN